MTTSSFKLLLTLMSFSMLAAAWTFQYFGYPPCEMCYWQRYPYMVAIPLGLLSYFLSSRIFAWLAALCMATTGAIGVFHSGVERKLWEGITTCSQGLDLTKSSDDLFNQMMSAPLVRCDEIPWQMFGFTMANLNAIGAFVMCAAWIWVATRPLP